MRFRPTGDARFTALVDIVIGWTDKPNVACDGSVFRNSVNTMHEPLCQPQSLRDPQRYCVNSQRSHSPLMNLHRSIFCNALSLVLLCMLLPSIGCDGVPPRPRIEKKSRAQERLENQPPALPLPAQTNTAQTNNASATAKETVAPHAGQRIETWDRYDLQGKPVGYSHFVAEATADGEVRIDMSDVLAVRRRDDILKQTYSQTSYETPDGQLKRFTAEIQQGDNLTKVEAKTSDRLLNLVVREGSQNPQTRQLPWNRQYGSLQAVQQSLRASPLKEKETRKLFQLLPIQFVVAEVELKATGYANVPIDGGQTKRLLEIAGKTLLNGQVIMTSTVWMDEQGEILKSYIPALDMITLRTTKERAEKSLNGTPPDLIALTRIGINKRVDRDAKQATYQINASVPELEFPDNPRQRVRKIDDKTFEIEVNAAPEPGPGDRELLPADSASGPKIQSDDAAVKELAMQAAGSSDQPYALAVALRDIVHRHVQSKDFTQAFASAADVVKSKSGDCTEHAVLLAAVCRARGIPARVAAGLVQVEDQQGTALNYHMWTLIWDGKVWLPVDAMFGSQPIGAERLELISTDLADDNTYACIVPVMRVLGQIKVEVK